MDFNCFLLVLEFIYMKMKIKKDLPIIMFALELLVGLIFQKNAWDILFHSNQGKRAKI